MRYVLLIVLALALTACSAPGQSCAEQSATFLEQIQPLAREWDDATKLAGSTPRASLSAQIGSLQGIRRRAQELTAPACAKPAQDKLIASMDTTIQTFLDFLAQKPDATVTAGFTEAGKLMGEFSAELVKIQSQ
jgi:xanthine dehydrogenase iron-sulfur cluster and FAD-binding subunit A